eukprot:COSAG05_NODE_321_length_11453_cov_62.107539_4_plen_127_part_00
MIFLEDEGCFNAIREEEFSQTKIREAGADLDLTRVEFHGFETATGAQKYILIGHDGITDPDIADEDGCMGYVADNKMAAKMKGRVGVGGTNCAHMLAPLPRQEMCALVLQNLALSDVVLVYLLRYQ